MAAPIAANGARADRHSQVPPPPPLLLYSSPRAHAMVSRAIGLTAQPYMCVVLRELRARMRCTLGRWVDATEDVRAALRELERGAGDARDVRAPKETPTELSVHKRWLYWVKMKRPSKKERSWVLIESGVDRLKLKI